MQTDHRVLVGDSRDLSAIPTNAVELVVTSPPYPMIELWDDTFGELDPTIGNALDAGEGDRAFELMHEQLDRVWSEVGRVLVDGGVACVNVGDATRSIGGAFQLFPNHARIVRSFRDLGFDVLPDALWRKPTNRGTKFMGSGMLPPNAYVTLEHEYVLVFRNGSSGRSFEPKADRRYEAAYFWEERNEWFSDVWTGVTGTGQATGDAALRERSGAYPFEIPYRLINMYSVYGDTVLDPFWGTGTTTVAAMVAARNSIGSELDAGLVEAFEDRLGDVDGLSRSIADRRLRAHEQFVAERRSEGKPPGYEAEHYDTSVMTKQERRLSLYAIESVRNEDDGFVVDHEPYRPS
ncbi:MAG: DNA-methyltransferase [Halobacteriota archaeon]